MARCVERPGQKPLLRFIRIGKILTAWLVMRLRAVFCRTRCKAVTVAICAARVERAQGNRTRRPSVLLFRLPQELKCSVAYRFAIASSSDQVGNSRFACPPFAHRRLVGHRLRAPRLTGTGALHLAALPGVGWGGSSRGSKSTAKARKRKSKRPFVCQTMLRSAGSGGGYENWCLPSQTDAETP